MVLLLHMELLENVSVQLEEPPAPEPVAVLPTKVNVPEGQGGVPVSVIVPLNVEGLRLSSTLPETMILQPSLVDNVKLTGKRLPIGNDSATGFENEPRNIHDVTRKTDKITVLIRCEMNEAYSFYGFRQARLESKRFRNEEKMLRFTKGNSDARFFSSNSVVKVPINLMEFRLFSKCFPVEDQCVLRI